MLVLLAIMIVSGLAWLLVMLAARRHGFDGKLGAVTMSPLAAAAVYALYIASVGLGRDLGKGIAWGSMIALAPMMIVFSSVFFYVERRFVPSEEGPANARAMMTAAALLMAWILFLLMLFDKLRP